MSVDQLVAQVLGRSFAPPPSLRPSDWAEANIILPAGSARPGPFRWSVTPYFRQPMDDLSVNSPVKTVVVVAGSQLGKTQAMLSALAYWVANDPKPIMAVWPTVDVAKRNVITRVDPLFDLIPAVKDRLIPERSRERGNSIFLKKIIGGSELIVVGANAPDPLRSSPINFVLLDEVSAFPAATSGGDVMELVEARQATFNLTRKTLLTSTPLDAGTCLITKAYEATDQRRYFIPCNGCGDLWAIEFADVQYPTDRPDLAALVCPGCGHRHSDHEKPDQLRRGEWRATAQCPDPTVAGYHLSGLYSPWRTWADIAQHHRRVCKDPAKLQVFVNTVLAQTWASEDGESLDVGDLPKRRQDFGGVIPAWVALITAGVDCQDDRVELTFWGWGADERSVALRHVVLWGDPSGAQLWQDLDGELLRPMPHARAVPDMVPMAVAIDSGGHFTSNVYAFCKPRSRRRVWAIRGKGGPGVPLWPNSTKQIYRAKGGCKVHTIGVDQAKRIIYGRLKTTQADAPGYVSFDSSLTTSWFEQLTSERLTTRYSRGKAIQEWICPAGTRNEALDCAAYAYSALHSLYIGGFDLAREAKALESVPLRDLGAPAPAAPPPRRPVIRVKSSLFS